MVHQEQLVSDVEKFLTSGRPLVFKVKKIHPLAQMPSREHGEENAGFDLSSVENVELAAGDRYLFSTGLQVSCPSGWWLKFHDRSGNAYKRGLHVLAGVIDNGYRGELKVLLLNINKKDSVPVAVCVGDRIAQMTQERMPEGEFQEEFDDLDASIRGINGFGSTGN